MNQALVGSAQKKQSAKGAAHDTGPVSKVSGAAVSFRPPNPFAGPVQMNPANDLLMQKITPLVSDLQEEKTPGQLKKSPGVIQRVNALATGNPYAFTIDQNDLNAGTGTTVGTRNYVNNAGTPKHNNVAWAYASWNAMGIIQTNNNGIAPNPAPGGNYDAGHALARQNGGLGNANAWVFPQNPLVNRGNGGTFGLWRAHEQQFHNDVNNNGFGGWVAIPY